MKRTHLAECSEGGFRLESSSVVLTDAAESSRLSRASGRPDGYRDVAGGLLSWRDEEKADPSVKCHHPSLPLRRQGRKADGTGPF